jgi:hypothetical protein
MTTQTPPYYSRHTLAETCGISVSQIDRHIRTGTCRLNKAAEKISGVGIRVNGQLASKFIAVMQAKKQTAAPTA